MKQWHIAVGLLLVLVALGLFLKRQQDNKNFITKAGDEVGDWVDDVGKALKGLFG